MVSRLITSVDEAGVGGLQASAEKIGFQFLPAIAARVQVAFNLLASVSPSVRWSNKGAYFKLPWLLWRSNKVMFL